MRNSDQGSNRVWSLYQRLWMALVLTLLGEGLAAAAPRSAIVVLVPEPETPATVQNEAMQRFVDNLRWQLGELDLSLQPTQAPNRFDLLSYASIAKNEATHVNALLSVWVVLYPERAVLYLYDAKEQALRARSLSPSTSPLVAAEELAIITRSAIVARLEGDSGEMAAVSLPKPSNASAPEAKARPSPELPPQASPATSKLGVGIRGSLLAGFPVTNQGMWPGAGLSAWLSIEQFRIGGGYGFYPETQLRSEQAVVALNRHTIELNLDYELYRGRVLALAEFVATFERLRRTTLFTRAPLEETERTHRWVTALGLRGRCELPLGGPVAFSFALGAEWVTNAFDFETSFDGKRNKVGQLSRVRPAFDLGLLWRFD